MKRISMLKELATYVGFPSDHIYYVYRQRYLVPSQKSVPLDAIYKKDTRSIHVYPQAFRTDEEIYSHTLEIVAHEACHHRQEILIEHNTPDMFDLMFYGMEEDRMKRKTLRWLGILESCILGYQTINSWQLYLLGKMSTSDAVREVLATIHGFLTRPQFRQKELSRLSVTWQKMYSLQNTFWKIYTESESKTDGLSISE